MLQTKTIHADTLALLKKIMALPELNGFNLVGGTSLALQIGHRISVDLDLFGNRPFEVSEILDLVRPLGEVRTLSQSKHILILNINGVKVDFVNYRYPLLQDVLLVDNIRLVSLQDIAAMKLAAIVGRGRKRDFTDLFFLLKHFSLSELMEFYNAKYNDGNEMIVVRSLTYFADADLDEDMQLLKKADWHTVKTKLLSEVNKLYK